MRNNASGGNIAPTINPSIGELNQYDSSGKRNAVGAYLDTIESNGKSALILNHHQGSVKL